MSQFVSDCSEQNLPFSEIALINHPRINLISDADVAKSFLKLQK